MTSPRILIVDDEPDLRWVLNGLFRDEGWEVTEAGDGAEALAVVQGGDFDAVLSDVRMPELDGIGLLRELVELDASLPVVLLSAVEDVETAVGAMKKGAYDYVAKPFDPPRLLATLQRAVDQRQLHREIAALQDRLDENRISFGVSANARELDRTLDLVAKQGSLSVLVQGESGTGKEVIAREIHRRSPFASGPFVAVDCGALPEQLMESQLFGHRKGAFTGADQNRDGLFRMADGGTLFLDEMANLPLPLQAKLLRALQERAVTPVGGGESIPFQARLICATNAKLPQDVEAGRFRVDLFHRIAEFVVDVPALRTRPDDIRHFAGVFLAEANAEMSRQIVGFSASAHLAMTQHDWHGNLRELRNAIRRAAVLCDAPEIDANHLRLETAQTTDDDGDPIGDPERSLTDRIKSATDALEARILSETLESTGGNKAAAARALQIDYTTMHRKLKRHGLL